MWDYRAAMEEAGGVAALLEETATALLSGDMSIAEWLEECKEEQTNDDLTLTDTGKWAQRLLYAVYAFCADRA